MDNEQWTMNNGQWTMNNGFDNLYRRKILRLNRRKSLRRYNHQIFEFSNH